MRAAHRAEMRELGALLRQSFVVILLRQLRIESEIELARPPKLESGLRQRVVPVLSPGMSLCQVRRVRRDLVSYHPVLAVLLVGQTQVLFWRDVAKHRRAEPSDHRRANRRSDVIV